MQNVTRLPERQAEPEKITINLGHVDLGRIDLLVREVRRLRQQRRPAGAGRACQVRGSVLTEILNFPYPQVRKNSTSDCLNE